MGLSVVGWRRLRGQVRRKTGKQVRTETGWGADWGQEEGRPLGGLDGVRWTPCSSLLSGSLERATGETDALV